MDSSSAQYMGLLSVLSPILLVVIGYLLKRMISVIDGNLQKLMETVAKMNITLEVLKSNEENRDKSVNSIGSKLEKQSEKIIEHTADIRENRHDIKGVKNNVDQAINLYNKLDGRVDNIQKNAS